MFESQTSQNIVKIRKKDQYTFSTHVWHQKMLLGRIKDSEYFLLISYNFDTTFRTWIFSHFSVFEG